MAVNIYVGGEFFDKIRESKAYYVDKTELLYDLVENTTNEVTLFTRPRRFGKTLTMTMMESFFDINRNSAELFRGLNITKHEEFCREWMNQYPVLFLTLKDVEGRSFDLAFDKLKAVIADVCKRHIAVLDNRNIDADDQGIFEKLKAKEASEEEIHNALLTLTRMLHAAYGKPVILFIDEYDVPLAKAQENGYYREMLDVIRGLMSTGLKTNSYLKFAVITGCLRISKESIFTGVNNFAAYSVLDEDFSQYFGFTQEEVDRLLKETDLTEKRDVFRKWYDGYTFGKTGVYCPWDVMCYTAALIRRSDAEPENYWKNTSSNGILKDFVARTELGLSDDFETLLNGGTITRAVSAELTYDTIYDDAANVWSILLMTGYLTKADPVSRENAAVLSIPNAEISSIFEDSVVSLFKSNLDKNRQRTLMEALWAGDAETAQKAISDFLWETISYHNYHETFYQAFMAGIFTGMGYIVKTDHEQGLGRSDIALLDRRNRRAIIIEAKKSKNEKQMKKDCQEANRQIAERKYAGDLRGYTTVLCYGISFYEKDAMVMKME